MNRCAKNGCVVDATIPIPTDPTEIHVELLPPVACSKLRCVACGCAVRNAVGIAFKTRADVPASALSQLYDLPDLAASPLLGPTRPEYRLYVCRCQRWLAIRANELENDDRDDESLPDLPWRCGGHPAIELPHDIHGVPISSAPKLRDLVVRGFHGADPPAIPPAEVDAQWITRLYYRLPATDAGGVAQVATGCLTDPEAVARQRALHFFGNVPDARARDVLAKALADDRALFADASDPRPLYTRDSTLEHTAWRVLAESVKQPGRAQDLARADALAGRASRALYDALCKSDPAWVLDHTADLVRAAPDRVEDLESSFRVAPTEWYKKLHGQARKAVS